MLNKEFEPGLFISNMRLFLSLIVCLSVFSSKAQQLVLRGDHPDPSVIKVGNEYWSVGTTSNWFPAFPLYHSTDLVNWRPAGHVFTKMPAWADYYLWAPEISYDNGKVYLYYTGHKKGGNLCVAAAVANKPEGPYTDLGPLMCQPDGSIDPFAMRDEQGKLYLIWKEDGNSIGQPTPIWAAEMKEDRTALIGEKQELFRANAPWEKYPGNPVLSATADWKCPGHGTMVEKEGRHYFLYHGYSTITGTYGGRQGLLNEFEFTPDGWVRFLNGNNYGKLSAPDKIEEHFSTQTLADNWHWSIFQNVQYSIANNTLKLQALPTIAGAYIGQSVLTSNYNAEVTVQKSSSAQAGLALIGDDKNILYAAIDSNTIRLIQVKKGEAQILAEEKISKPAAINLRVQVKNNTQVTFTYSEGGSTFTILNNNAADISYLPPWDRAVRVGLVSKGAVDKAAFFKDFILVNEASASGENIVRKSN